MARKGPSEGRGGVGVGRDITRSPYPSRRKQIATYPAWAIHDSGGELPRRPVSPNGEVHRACRRGYRIQMPMEIIRIPSILAMTPPSGAASYTISGAGSFAEWAAALAAILAVAVTVQISRQVRETSQKREESEDDKLRRQAMTRAHIRLTSGEVASARHRLGLVLNLPSKKRRKAVKRREQQCIKDFYTLVWALESIRNLRTTWKVKSTDGKPSDFLAWNEAALYTTLDELYPLLRDVKTDFLRQSTDAWDSVAESRLATGTSAPKGDAAP
jgi:hypothetical protein